MSYDSFEASDLAIECMHGQFLCNKQVQVGYAFSATRRPSATARRRQRLLAANNPNNAVQPHTMFGTGARRPPAPFPPRPPAAAAAIRRHGRAAAAARRLWGHGRTELSAFTPFLM